MKLRKNRKSIRIPVSAMGDIAFLLLIFYMATTMMTDQKPREVSLPEVKADIKSTPYPLIIYLDKELARTKSAYFYNEIVPLHALDQKIKEQAATAPASFRVYLNIEKNLPYHFMNEVIIALKNAGVRRLIITTRPKQSK